MDYPLVSDLRIGMSFVIAKSPCDTTAVQCSDLLICGSVIAALKVVGSWSDDSISFCLLRIVIVHSFFTVLVTLAMNGQSLCILSELCSWYRQTLPLVSFEPTFGNNRNLILKWVNDRWK